MAETLSAISVLSRLGSAFNCCNFPSFCLKPLQVKCFECLLKGQDIIAVLPTGFGKSLLFQLLPDFLPVKADKNIVIVVCPLNSIIEDQLKVLQKRGITPDVLQLNHDEREAIDSLFNYSELADESAERSLSNPSARLMNGEVQIVFAHPEALLSKEERQLMNSKAFQRNVVACVVDEAHCVEIWSEDFRKDFKDLSALKAFFPTVPVMALTATAPPQMLKNLKHSLSLKTDCKVIAANPNRSNIYLEKKVRMSNHHGYEGFDQILVPIANDLALQRERYPMTIIYLKLKYCGYAYGLFERILADKQFVGETKDPSGRLFAQFHAPQTKRMKKSIISEIKEENSRIRVLFATSALGMGVNAPYVEHIIHISPPSNLESYMQEIGRAGRTGKPACATLFYNNSDIASNKVHVQEQMKDYCRSEESCLRTLILKYLGFLSVTQERCCCVCDGQCNTSVSSAPKVMKTKVREVPADNKPVLEGLISSEITYFEALNDLTGLMLFTYKSESNLAQKIMEGIEFIKTEPDLLDTFGIWDETCSSKIFSLITHYAPLIQVEASHS